jgi:hypothetical protein
MFGNKEKEITTEEQRDIPVASPRGQKVTASSVSE